MPDLSAVDNLIETITNHLPGWCTEAKAKRIMRIVVAAEARLVVELGVFGGRSFVPLALGVKAVSPTGKAIGLDPYEAAPTLEGTNDPANDKYWAAMDFAPIAAAAQRGIEQAGVAEIATLVRKRSLDAVADFEDGTIDVLHQDSNHSEEVSCAEVDAWVRKIRPGGVWIVDDANWPSTQAAQRKLASLGFTPLEANRFTNGHDDAWAALKAPK